MYVMLRNVRRRPEEAAQTRRALLSAALQEFADRGYAAATLAGIAERAGVTRGAAYHHFPDKAALYLTTIAELWAEAATPVWDRLNDDGPPLRRVADFLVTFFTALERDATLRAVFGLSMRSADGVPELARGLDDKRTVMERWKQQLIDLLSTTELRPGITPDTAAVAIITAVNGTAATWVACPELFSPAQKAEALAETIVRGVSDR